MNGELLLEPYDHVLDVIPMLSLSSFPLCWKNGFPWQAYLEWKLGPAWVTLWKLSQSVSFLPSLNENLCHGLLRHHIASNELPWWLR